MGMSSRWKSYNITQTLYFDHAAVRLLAAMHCVLLNLWLIEVAGFFVPIDTSMLNMLRTYLLKCPFETKIRGL